MEPSAISIHTRAYRIRNSAVRGILMALASSVRMRICMCTHVPEQYTKRTTQYEWVRAKQQTSSRTAVRDAHTHLYDACGRAIVNRNLEGVS